MLTRCRQQQQIITCTSVDGKMNIYESNRFDHSFTFISTNNDMFHRHISMA